jgi:dipeptidyl aminopeptidase/acylaminoacyl peptidase
MNADGSNPVNLTHHESNDYWPAWSPDGTKIAFTSNRDGNNEIYVMNADGSNPVNLTRNESNDYWPAWSPDGTKIAFASLRSGNNDIYIMNADGSNVFQLTTRGGTEPVWRPAVRGDDLLLKLPTVIPLPPYQTAVPSATLANILIRYVAGSGASVNVRTGPSLSASVAFQAKSGGTDYAIGRSADGKWVKVVNGWVSVDVIQFVSGRMDALPVMEG